MPGSIVIRENPVKLSERFHLTLRGEDEFSGGHTPVFYSYQDDDKASGGFWSCSFRIRADDLTLSEMFENGLGRGVHSYGEGMKVLHEGFIYEMIYNLPPNQYLISLENMVNRVQMRADYDGDGIVERSTQLNNTDSQDKYGIKEIILSGGELTSLTVADQAAQKFLNVRGFPIPEPDIGAGSGEVFLEVFCRGYVDTLSWRTYNQTANTSSVNMSQLVSDIIGTRAKTTIKPVSSWDETADVEEGRPTDFNSLSPAWDQQAQEATGDFDTLTQDGTSTFTASSSAAKVGTNGFIASIDSSGNFAAGNFTTPSAETTITAECWFDPNSAYANGESNVVIQLDQSGNAHVVDVRIRNNGGQLQAGLKYKDDAGSAFDSSWHNISDQFVHLRAYWKASSGPGSDDGILYFYIDGVQKESITGLDTDTLNVDSVLFGHRGTYTTSPTSVSIHLDECQWSNGPGSPVWITEAAALTGSYGMAVTVEDTTARYGELTSPSGETQISVECRIDPNTLTMATNDIFTFIHCNGEFKVELAFDGTNYEVRATANLDSGTSSTARHDITDVPHTVRATWGQSSGADDGFLYLYVDGILIESLTVLDNDTLSVDEVRFGVTADLDSGTSGVLLIDNMRWSNESVVTIVSESGVGEFIADFSATGNSTLVDQELDADRRALDIIQGAVALGDSGNRPWVFYVTEGRKAVMKVAAPPTVD